MHKKTEDFYPITLLRDQKDKIKNIFHISDIHLERNYDRKKEYLEVIDNFLLDIEKSKKQYNLIVITGDLIDFKQAVTNEGIDNLITVLTKLATYYPLVIIPGNHDVNEKNKEDIDLIQSVYKKIITKNEIYYLRDSGIYRYNNILFSHVSVFDKKVLDYDLIQKRRGDKVIALYHGFVLNPSNNKLEFMKMKNSINYHKFSKYDATLLGDIHKQIYVTKTIAYASSLIQRSYGEDIMDHGYIKWNLEGRITSEFIRVKNNYAFVNFVAKNGTIKGPEAKDIPKNIRVKIKYINTDIKKIDNFINKLKNKYNLLEVRKEQILETTTTKILGKDIENINMRSDKIIINMMKKYIFECNKKRSDKINVKDMTELHKKYYKELRCNIEKKKIKFIKLKFSNIHSYGEDNEFTFDDSNKVIGLLGDNRVGKSTIVDILTFVLFNRTLRAGGVMKDGILNIHKKDFSIELYLKIDETFYKIEKRGHKITKRLVKDTKIYKKHDENDNYKLVRTLDETKIAEYMKTFLGFSYDHFVFSSLMGQYNNDREILDKTTKEKREILLYFMNIDFFEKIKKKVSSDIKDNNNLKNNLKTEIDNFIEKEKSYKEDLKEFNRIEKELDIDKQKLLEFEQKLREIEREYIKIDIDNIIDTKKELNQLKNENKKLCNDIIERDLVIKEKRDNLYDIVCKDDDVKELKEVCKKEILRDIRNRKFYKENKIQINKLLKNDSNKKKIKDKLFEISIRNVNEIKENNDEIKEYEDDVKRIEKEINNNSEKIKQYEKNIELFEQNKKHNKDIKKLEIKVNELKINIEKITKQRDIYMRKINTHEVNKDYLKEKRRFFKMLEVKNNKLNNYLTIVQYNGLPMTITKTISKNLEHTVNHILKKFTDIQINILVEFVGKTAHFDIYKKEGNKMINAVNSSGFERFAINMAFKIGISNVSNIGLPSIFIIDEQLACVDEYNICHINRLFDYLRDNFSCNLVITHSNRVKDKFDNIITVKREGQYSKIK